MVAWLSTPVSTPWFCPLCRVTVKKSILIDRKIEERCLDIMEVYEQRIAELELIVNTEVKGCIKKEVKNGGITD